MFRGVLVPDGTAVLALLSLLVAGGAAARGDAPGSCDRSCLKGLMDQYLAALVAHDPARLPTTPTVKFTENTNRLALGDGLWQTIDGLGTFKLYIEDPASEQVALYGTVKENGLTALLSARLKAHDRRVSEIETYVVRQQSGVHGTFDALVRSDPLWDQPVPVAERSTRQALIHAANQYFEGIVHGDGDIVPFAPDCVRIENGQQTAPTPASASRPAMSTQASFNTKMFNYIHEIDHRRFLLVDPERGLVYVTATFEHPGNIDTPLRRTAAGALNPKSLASYPNTTGIIETFKIRGGRIHHIFAYVTLLPYRQQPGW
ncbi:MAG TPA: hypothetical protein VMU40_01935 [Steroidobacteraceae bacterium]|nr:hypothetical protein [Steroidobacteraceae bacterium]